MLLGRRLVKLPGLKRAPDVDLGSNLCLLRSDTESPEAGQRLATLKATAAAWRFTQRVVVPARDSGILVKAHDSAFTLVETGAIASPEYALLKITNHEKRDS
jgi:hypothetical protein